METITKPIEIKDLPSPKGNILLGNLSEFKADQRHLVLERWVEEHGDLLRISFVGKDLIVSANADINHDILRSRPEKFRRFYKINEIMSEMGFVGVFNAEGETWKKHRKPTTEALNAKKVIEYFPIVKKKTTELLNKWIQLSQHSPSIEVQPELMKFTIDITTHIALGHELDTIHGKEDSFQKHLDIIFPMINHRITSPFAYWRYFKKKRDRELENSLREIEQFIGSKIDETINRLKDFPSLKEKPNNFLEALLVEQENDESFTRDDVYGNILTVLLAGEDTTSNSIAWTLFYLAQNPVLVNRIKEEANEVYGDQMVVDQHDKIAFLKLADAAAQEAIRLKPVTPNLYMQANEDCVIQNLKIPKDMVVLMQNHVPQIREENFSEAKQFIPDRWLKGGCPHHQNHSPAKIKAFGGGMRHCPGKFLAMQEMTVAISAICKNFDFKLTVKPSEVIEQFEFTMFPENLFIQFTPTR